MPKKFFKIFFILFIGYVILIPNTKISADEKYKFQIKPDSSQTNSYMSVTDFYNIPVFTETTHSNKNSNVYEEEELDKELTELVFTENIKKSDTEKTPEAASLESNLFTKEKTINAKEHYSDENNTIIKILFIMLLSSILIICMTIIFTNKEEKNI